MSAQDAGPVVVCCATAEAAAIRDALAELTAAGHSLDIVEGVEADPRLLVPVIERLHGDGLYVLCRSASLGRDTIEQLREILLTHHVPFGRTVTVATTRPRELVERIRASVVRSGTRKPQRTTLILGVDGSPGTKPKIPQLAPAPIVRSRGSRAPVDDAFENALTGRQPVIAESERVAEDDGSDFDPPTIELPDRKTREAAMATPLSEQDSAAISLTDAAIELLDDHDVDSSLAGLDASKLDFSDLERADSGKILIAPFPRVAVRSGNTSISPAPTAPVVAAPPSIPAPPMPRAAVAAPPPRTPEPPPAAHPPQDVLAAPLPASSSTVAVGPAIAPPISSPGTFPSMSSMSSPVGAAASGGSSASASALPDQPKRSSASVLAAGGLVLVAVIALGVVWAVRTGDDEAPKTSAADSSTASTTPTPNASDDGASPADAADPPAGPSDEPQGDDAQPGDDGLASPLVAVALEERKVRALDVLLVASKSAGPMSHGDAATYCEALDLAGLSGWRLPELGELSSLSEAGMVGPAVYWSRTAGDTFGDTHFAWNGGKRRVQPQYGTCRVLCVRPDQAMP